MMQEQIRREQEGGNRQGTAARERKAAQGTAGVADLALERTAGEIIPIFNIARPDSLAVLRELGDGNVLQSVGKVW